MCSFAREKKRGCVKLRVTSLLGWFSFRLSSQSIFLRSVAHLSEVKQQLDHHSSGTHQIRESVMSIHVYVSVCGSYFGPRCGSWALQSEPETQCQGEHIHYWVRRDHLLNYMGKIKILYVLIVPSVIACIRVPCLVSNPLAQWESFFSLTKTWQSHRRSWTSSKYCTSTKIFAL